MHTNSINLVHGRVLQRRYTAAWMAILAAWALVGGGCRSVPNAGLEPGVTGKASPTTATNAPTATGASTNGIAEDGAQAPSSTDPYEQMRQLTRAMAIVRQDYVDPDRTD